MSAKIATPGFLKTAVFWNESYGLIIPAYDVSNKVLSCDSNYTVNVVMWSKFGDSGISGKSYHNVNFIGISPEKPLFLRGGLGSSLSLSLIWDWH